MIELLVVASPAAQAVAVVGVLVAVVGLVMDSVTRKGGNS